MSERLLDCKFLAMQQTEQLSAIKPKKNKSYRSVFSIGGEHLLPAFVLASLGFQLILLFLMSFLAVGTWRLSYRPVPTLVQLDEGRSIRVHPTGALERTPESIKKFVGSTSVLLFNWGKGSLADLRGSETSVSDPGVSVTSKSDLKVTTAAWETSFALASDFRQPFLEKLASLIPKSVWLGRAQVVLEMSHISEPETIKPGNWKVTQVANLLVFNGSHPTGQIIPFNKDFYVRAIDMPPLPLPEIATPLQRTVYKIREANLEIYDIKDSSEETNSVN